MERNSAAARHSWARQHAWLLLNFLPFPVGQTIYAHCTTTKNGQTFFPLLGDNSSHVLLSQGRWRRLQVKKWLPRSLLPSRNAHFVPTPTHAFYVFSTPSLRHSTAVFSRIPSLAPFASLSTHKDPRLSLQAL